MQDGKVFGLDKKGGGAIAVRFRRHSSHADPHSDVYTIRDSFLVDNHHILFYQLRPIPIRQQMLVREHLWAFMPPDDQNRGALQRRQLYLLRLEQLATDIPSLNPEHVASAIHG